MPLEGVPALPGQAIDSSGIEAGGESKLASMAARNAVYGAGSTSLARQGHAQQGPERGGDEQTREIRAIEITGSNIGDAPLLPESLSQIPVDVGMASVTADGAYDTRICHSAMADWGAHAILPPRKTAKPWKPSTAGAIARNEGPRASKNL